jgi:hypothetical protein
MTPKDEERVFMLISDMLEGLYRVLPVIEDAEEDPYYKQEYIKSIRMEVTDLIERAERE